MSGRRRAVSQSWLLPKDPRSGYHVSMLGVVWLSPDGLGKSSIGMDYRRGSRHVRCQVAPRLCGCRGRSGLVLTAGRSICFAISHLVRRRVSWSDGPRHDSSAPHGDDNHILGHGARGCSPQRRSTPLGMPLENPNTAAGGGTTRTAQHVLYEPCLGQACTWLESCHFPLI